MGDTLQTVLVIANYLSVFVMLACTVLVATQRESKMQKLILIECFSLLICCLGFLLRIETTTLEVMVASQKLIYGSVTHAMLIMLLFIIRYCDLKYPKWLPWIFHGVNIVITVLVLLDDRLHLLYKSTSLVDGVFTKEYGPLHTIAIVVFGLYMAASVVIAIIFSVKNMRKRTKYVWRMLVAVSIPCLSYILSKALGDDTDVQPIGFAIFAILLIIMVYHDNLYDVKNIAARYSIESVSEALIIFDENYHFKGCNAVAREYFPILNEINLDSDIRKESEILTAMYEEKLSEFHFEDKIFDVSLRPINSGNKSAGRVIWMNDVTAERNYTKLLESEVVTLSDISYKDQLTGLENRRSYELKIDSIKNSDVESNITFFALDINGLKATNDNYGHATGDELIKASAEIIQSVFSAIGNVYRIGGDEFAVFIIGEVNVEALEKAFVEGVRTYKGSYKHKISISYGWQNGIVPSETNIDDLIKAADKEMYKFKDQYYAQAKIARRVV